MSRTRRHRDRREEEVDASQGKFGAEFDEEELLKEGGEVLSISEVHVLLKREMERDRSDEPNNRDPMTIPVFKKCFEYCETFNRIKDETTIQQIRDELVEYGAFEHQQQKLQQQEEGLDVYDEDDAKKLYLSRFEMAQLSNLGVESAEEAKVLIPTLTTKNEAMLQSLLDELATKRKFST